MPTAETLYSGSARLIEDQFQFQACDIINTHINPIILFSVHVNAMFRFIKQLKGIHVNIAIVNSIERII